MNELPNELVLLIASLVPPYELHKFGLLSTRFRAACSMRILTRWPGFALKNVSSQTYATLQKTDYFSLGFHYLTALFRTFGVTVTSFAIILKLNIEDDLTLPESSHLMPDSMSHTEATLIFRAIETTLNAYLESSPPIHPCCDTHDMHLLLQWASFFGNKLLSKLCIDHILQLASDNELEPTDLEPLDQLDNAMETATIDTTPSVDAMFYDVRATLTSAFLLCAQGSGNADIGALLLATRWVQLDVWGQQTLAEAARAGNAEFLKMLLEWKWPEEHVGVIGEWVPGNADLAFSWASMNNHVECMTVLISSGVLMSIDVASEVFAG
ncbi:hypothetical protein HDU78_005385 [Chytriomyces hyalinus]|nr:hypothetical protein HDU78_005385 [Chytriomyces hyalinus]